MTTIYILKIFKYERLLKLKIKKQLSQVNMKKILETMLKIQFYTYIHTYIYIKLKILKERYFSAFSITLSILSHYSKPISFLLF